MGGEPEAAEDDTLARSRRKALDILKL